MDINGRADLGRFVKAQDACGYMSELRELGNGREVSQWIWYEFPCLKTIGN